jgi:cytochrome c oxidase subunit 1
MVDTVVSHTERGGSRILDAALPMLRALLWGVSGYIIGAWITALIVGAGFANERAVTVGYALGVTGWVLGGGAWEGWVLPWFGRPSTWDEGHGAARYFRFVTDHKVIGLQYLWAAIFTFGSAGLIAMAMRIELISPQLSFFSSNQGFNTAVGIHGTLMVLAVAVVAIVGGFGNYFVPLMVGAPDMTFPKLNGVSWWFVLPGVFAILLSPLLGGFQTGWTGYAPLSAQDAPGQDLYFLGIAALGLSSLLTAINVIATTLYMRAPGLTMRRLPVFVWAMLVTSVLNLLWLPVVTVGMVMGLLDRIIPTQFFTAGGQSVLWQDLFWLFGHPEVYVIMLPAWGMWLEIISVFSRKTLFGYKWVIAGFFGVMVLSSFVWAHHMFTTTADVRLIPFMTTTEVISIPTGFVYIAALGTLWQGRVRLKTPMLFILMSVLNFLIGGFTGVFLADVPADFQLHNTYFVVAHFHYTIVGGMVFAWLGATYYWFPKFSGHMYNETIGKLSAWVIFVAYNATFLAMFVSGFEGMNRRVAVYPSYLHGTNEWTSVWAFVLGLGFFVAFLNIVISWFQGAPAGDNPWGGTTLEWQTSSPPPHENFHKEPVVSKDFYLYGQEAKT